MPHEFKEALSESHTAFRELVMPPLLKVFEGGTIVPTEGAPGELEQMLDRDAGIDAIMFSEYGVYGIASRIQFDANYRTFTIRKERQSGRTTEWEKLQRAARYGAMAPSFTVQAYVDRTDMKLLDAAVVCTNDLVRWIENNPCETRTTGRDQYGQAEFWVVPWDKLQKTESVWFRELTPNILE